jgi:hypothetical protein
MKVTVFALVLLVTLVGLAPWSADAGTREHVVKGEGVVAASGKTLPYGFKVEARGTPKQAQGKVAFSTLLPQPITGQVKCLAVQGKRAAIAGKFDEPLASDRTHFLIVLQDNGPVQDPPVDTLHAEATNGLVGCKHALDQPGTPLREGNIRIR